MPVSRRARSIARFVALSTIIVVCSSLLTPTAEGQAARRPIARRAIAQVQFGAYVDGMTSDPTRLSAFEAQIGRRTDIASYYWGFGDVFPGAVERDFADGGRRRVLVSWDMGPTRFAEWSAGRHDAYLAQIAAAARAYPYPLFVRPWPEMNGDWQDFQPTASGERRYGGTYAEFKAAWRHVVDYFRARGVTNLRWVFNPTADTYAGTTPVSKIWPGSAYVDVLGLDGFNWGADASWGRWLTFDQIFASQYRRLTALHASAPVWICEVASKEPSKDDGAPVDTAHSKATWIRETLASRSFPRVTALVWFQAAKERDWRLDSSDESLAAFRAVVASNGRVRSR